MPKSELLELYDDYISGRPVFYRTAHSCRQLTSADFLSVHLTDPERACRTLLRSQLPVRFFGRSFEPTESSLAEAVRYAQNFPSATILSPCKIKQPRRPSLTSRLSLDEIESHLSRLLSPPAPPQYPCRYMVTEEGFLWHHCDPKQILKPYVNYNRYNKESDFLHDVRLVSRSYRRRLSVSLDPPLLDTRYPQNPLGDLLRI